MSLTRLSLPFIACGADSNPVFITTTTQPQHLPSFVMRNPLIRLECGMLLRRMGAQYSQLMRNAGVNSYDWGALPPAF